MLEVAPEPARGGEIAQIGSVRLGLVPVPDRPAAPSRASGVETGPSPAKGVAYGRSTHLKARGAAASLEAGRRSGGDCCAGRGRTARLPRRSGHDRAGSLSLAFLDFPVQHLQCVLLTGSEGERPAGRFPAVHRRRGYAEQAGELGDRESAPAAQLRHPGSGNMKRDPMAT